MAIPNYMSAVLGEHILSWNPAPGARATIPYTFSTDLKPTILFGNTRYYPFSTEQQGFLKLALQQWSNVANLTFNEVSRPQAKFGFQNFESTDSVWSQQSAVTMFGFRELPNGNRQIDGGTSLFAPSHIPSFAPGTYGFMAMIHEMGHGLGLKHPGNYDGTTGSAEPPYLEDFGLRDDNTASLMSYHYFTPDGGATYPLPTTPMLYDIAAIQYLYGANTTFNAGNTTYTLTDTPTMQTRWDAGGIDTLNTTSYLGNVKVDLREGVDYATIVGKNYTLNAYNSKIENATTGNGSDTVYGNQYANLINLGAGNDTVLAGSGNDTINGGTGNDSLTGGAGNDSIFGDDGRDKLYGSDGNDYLHGKGGFDTIYGGNGNDTIYDGSENDVVYGDAGKDRIVAGVGNDTLYGGADIDTFVFAPGGGQDKIMDFSEQDVIDLKAFTTAFNKLTFTNDSTAHTWSVDLVQAGSNILHLVTNEFTGTWSADDFVFV